jgi:hypothetical protein
MISQSCPSREEIIRFIEGDAPEEHKKKFLDHVLVCPECRVILDASVELQEAGQDILRDLERLDLGSPEARKKLRTCARRELRALRGGRRPGVWTRRWLAVPAAGAVLALFVVLGILPGLRKGQGPMAERNAAGIEIGLITPRGSNAAEPGDFRWTRIPGVRTYRLDIYDQTLEPIHQSPSLVGAHYTPPSAVTGTLRKGSVYFWKITALMEDGRTVESEFGRFVLQR